MKNQTKNTERKTYELKLKELLDNCTFYTKEDGSYMTPREIFEDDFKMLVETPLKYFSIPRYKLTEQESEKDNEDLIIYSNAGGGAAGAYAVMKESIELLNGGTLDFISTEDKTTLDLRRAIVNSIKREAVQPTQKLKELSTLQKYRVLNALLYTNECGYFINEPNMLMKNFKVEFDDIAHSIKAIPSWSYRADGIVAETHLSVDQETIEKLFDKYPLFDLKFSKEILQEMMECESEDILQAQKDYKELYGSSDTKVDELFTALLKIKKSA